MTIRVRAASASVAGVLAIVLCLASSCGGSGGSSAWVVEAKVRLALLEKLGTDGLKVEVAVSGDTATLTGEVSRRATEELAEEVALTVPGIARVDNRIELAKEPGGAVERIARDAAREVDDAMLESRVKLAIGAELGSRVGRIEVEVVGGVVSLRGAVPDRERRNLAVKTAEGVKGVSRVVDLLRVGD